MSPGNGFEHLEPAERELLEKWLEAPDALTAEERVRLEASPRCA